MMLRGLNREPIKILYRLKQGRALRFIAGLLGPAHNLDVHTSELTTGRRLDHRSPPSRPARLGSPGCVPAPSPARAPVAACATALAVPAPYPAGGTKSWYLSARRFALAISFRSLGVFCWSQVQQMAA